MEFVAFLALAFVVAVAFIWRSRRSTSSGPETLTKGLPDDLRDKNTGSIGIGHTGGGRTGDGGGAGGGF